MYAENTAFSHIKLLMQEKLTKQMLPPTGKITFLVFRIIKNTSILRQSILFEKNFKVKEHFFRSEELSFNFFSSYLIIWDSNEIDSYQCYVLL